MQLLLLHYNNYFNRIIKKKDTVADYKSADTNYKEVANINFNPGDGVNTSIVLGLGQNGSIFTDDEFDYLVAYETVDNINYIRGRWFILEQDRKRGGQYELTLKRDVIADNYLAVVNSPIFLEKGFINDVNDPLLYNSESMNVNQIKQEEIPLKDETKSGWVVGYIPSDAFPKVEPAYDRVEKTVTIPMAANITVNGLSSWNYWNYCSNNSDYKFIADTYGKRKVTVKIKGHKTMPDVSLVNNIFEAGEYTFYVNSTDTGAYTQKYRYSKSTWGPIEPANYPQEYKDYTPVSVESLLATNICNDIFNSVRNNATFNSSLNTVLSSSISIGDTSALRALQDKILLDSSTNTYYRINIITNYEETPITITSSVFGGQVALNALNSARTIKYSLSGDYTTFTASNASTSYAIQLNQVGVSLYVDLNSDRAHLNDAPYDMFCIPFSDTLKLKSGSTEFTCSKNIALSMATEIAKDLGSGTVYDVQLLPYCPNRVLVVNSSSPSSVLDLSRVKYDLIKESSTNKPKSAVIWCTESTFQVPIKVDKQVNEFIPTSDAPGMIQTGIYYAMMNEYIHSYTARMSIKATDILVYKVDRYTNRIISSNYIYNNIEVTTDDFLNIFEDGSEGQPEIHIDLHDYYFDDFYYVFKILKGISWIESQNTDEFAKQLRITKEYNILQPGDDALSRKLANECDVLRLVSQNYSAIFEFSAAKSGGVDGFLADCTYKPWSPYIHILPKLKGLYGDNFVSIDDARGLICGGDMSLPQLSNAWANYQLQNKTYQEMFDRQIKNMDVQNDINKQNARWQLALSPVTGGASGAAAFGQFGGMRGAAIGAAAGAVGGLATSALDYRNTLRMMEENRQYSIDMYGYNLQNIQAIPTSLTKTSALTYNTRVWPFIEYYTCTDAERSALKDKMKYNGMTIMKIGKLTDYKLGEDNFYKGQLIRLNIKVDSHMAYEIYNELNKGVYL